MRIKSLKVENFRGMNDFSLAFDPKVTVIVAPNGIGKSSILSATATLLSWFVARLRRDSGVGHSIRDIDISNGKAFSALQAQVELPLSGTTATWSLVRGRVRDRKSDLSELNHALVSYRVDDVDLSLPIIVFYGVTRAVIDVPVRIRTKHTFNKVDAYDRAFEGHANFRLFFEWFRQREDIENEALAISRYSDSPFQTDPQLDAARQAIAQILPEYKNLRVRRSPLRMTIEKSGAELQVDQLSDGEKCYIALVGDIARRLSVASGEGSNPLQGAGIVLIDEIDLHLHPAWQRQVVPKLTQVFPNIQFIVSTHSPQVIGETVAGSIRALQRGDNGIELSVPQQAYGLNSVALLRSIMGDKGISTSVDSQIETIEIEIVSGRIDKAKELLSQLKDQTGGSTEELAGLEADIVNNSPLD